MVKKIELNEQPIVDKKYLYINFVQYIEEFYFVYNIHKIPLSREFNKWIQVYGIKAFNEKLRKKYDADLFNLN